MHLLDTESFQVTFGRHSQRKKPKLQVTDLQVSLHTYALIMYVYMYVYIYKHMWFLCHLLSCIAPCVLYVMTELVNRHIYICVFSCAFELYPLSEQSVLRHLNCYNSVASLSVDTVYMYM